MTAPNLPRLLSILSKRGTRVGLAESCTGGLATYALAQIPGASEVLKNAWVTYSDHSKVKFLGVRAATLRKWGAVSEAVVREMAKGALKKGDGLNLAIAITGIAGPSGATEGKPVGTVWFAWARGAGRGVKVISELRHFRGSRASIQLAAARYAWSKVVQVL